MEVDTLVNSIRETVTNSARANAVFGDPVTAQGRTVIPVARIMYGFGSGTGSKPGRDPLTQGESGVGGGGGAKVIPVGVVEITAEGTRYIPFVSPGKVAVVAVAGVILGMWMGRRRSNRRRWR